MPTDKELMQQALDALEEAQDYTSCPTFSPSMTQQCAVAAVALRARLAQPEPEQVAQVQVAEDYYAHVIWTEGVNPVVLDQKFLYVAPPQREWQWLTDEEVEKIQMSASSKISAIYIAEAQVKGKNSD